MSSTVENSLRTQPRRRIDSATSSADATAGMGAAREPAADIGTTSPLGEEAPVQLRIASPYVLEARQLVKIYRKNQHQVTVLDGCDFTAVEGKMTAILGQSGSGKSTLLHLLGTLDAPDSGEIYFDGCRIDNLPRRKRDRFRNSQLGMIFQFYHLLPEVTALQNVLLPMMIQQGFWGYLRNRQAIKQRATELLRSVGIEHRLHHRPSELSGGEMQRCAIARALIAQPKLLLADEPTGNLDRSTGRQILSLLKQLNEEQNLTIVMVTHDESIAADCDAVIHLADGRIKR